MEVIHFMQYLKIAHLRKDSYAVTLASQNKEVYRKTGLYKGQIKMSEGFDDPLDDFKEYM